MKNARTKFVVALVLFVIGISCGLLLIRYIAVNSPGKSSLSSTLRAEVDGYLLGVILIQIVAIGTSISYLRDTRKQPRSEQRDRFLRFMAWLLILAGIFAMLIYVLLLLLLNG